MIRLDKVTYTLSVAVETFVMDQLGASGDVISGAWERVAIDIILASSLLGAVIFIYTKVFEGLIDRKIDDRVRLITDEIVAKLKGISVEIEQLESHHETERPSDDNH